MITKFAVYVVCDVVPPCQLCFFFWYCTFLPYLYYSVH